MDNIEIKIKEYIRNLSPNILPVKNFSDITTEKIRGGDYNLNFRVTLDNHNFLMRFNIEPQSGLENQIEYEYKTLEFLAPYKIAPVPYHLNNTQKFFPYGLLIEQYINGSKLVFSIDTVKRAAKTLAKLHTIPLNNKEFLMRWGNPLRQQFDITCNSLAQYKTRKAANKKLTLLGEKIIKAMEAKLPRIEKNFKPKSFIHTDVVPSNFVDTGSKIYLIDWEKGRIDDPSYDLAMFFFRLANLWDSPRVLTKNEKKAFMEVYITETGDTSIQKRINDRLILITLQSILWAAGRIADVKEGTIDKMLGRQNYERYKKAFQLDELEKIADNL